MSIDMSTQEANDSKPVFIGVFFSVYAWALLESIALSRRLTIHFHLIATLYCIVFLFLSCRRTLRFHGSIMHMFNALRWSKRRMNLTDMASAVILVAIGYTLGNLIGKGFFELWLFSAALCFIPWLRVPLCRDYFILACVLLWIGAASGTINRIGLFDMLSLPLAAWGFWAAALLSVFWNSENSRRRARATDRNITPLKQQQMTNELVKPE